MIGNHDPGEGGEYQPEPDAFSFDLKSERLSLKPEATVPEWYKGGQDNYQSYLNGKLAPPALAMYREIDSIITEHDWDGPNSNSLLVNRIADSGLSDYKQALRHGLIALRLKAKLFGVPPHEGRPDQAHAIVLHVVQTIEEAFFAAAPDPVSYRNRTIQILTIHNEYETMLADMKMITRRGDSD